ncbi:MAG: hypothetical protein WB586_06000 [Chthoniobacterales bacterium]
MKVAFPRFRGDPAPVTEKGPSEHASQPGKRSPIFFGIIAILTIGIATMLALVLLQLITAGP